MSQKTDQFLSMIVPIVQAEYKRRLATGKWVLPSVCIAQAALETGWGGSSLMMNANAFFGIKASKSWTGKVYNAKTKECYDGINYTTITDGFRAYNSPAESITDYYNLIINNSRYVGAVNNPDPYSAIQAIKNGGYATSPTYVANVSNLIKGYDLTKFDKVTNDTVVSVEPVVNSTVGVSTKVLEYLAQGVRSGQFGNGDVRKKHLGPLYTAVQNIINKS